MDWKEAVKARFMDAIKLVFPQPTPLMGDKWFLFPADDPKTAKSVAGLRRGLKGEAGGKSADVAGAKTAGEGKSQAAMPDFQFLGVRKLAKATGGDAPATAKRILKALSFPAQAVRVEIEDDWKINLWLTRPESAAEVAAWQPPTPPTPPPASGGPASEK